MDQWYANPKRNRLGQASRGTLRQYARTRARGGRGRTLNLDSCVVLIRAQRQPFQLAEKQVSVNTMFGSVRNRFARFVRLAQP